MVKGGRVLAEELSGLSEQGAGTLLLKESEPVEALDKYNPVKLCSHSLRGEPKDGLETVVLPRALVTNNYEQATYCLDCVLEALK